MTKEEEITPALKETMEKAGLQIVLKILCEWTSEYQPVISRILSCALETYKNRYEDAERSSHIQRVFVKKPSKRSSHDRKNQ